MQPLRHQIKLEQIDQGMAFLSIRLEGDLTSTSATPLADDVKSRVEKLEGRPFGLLFDLRSVSSCDDGGAGAMQKIEMGAADKGLEVVAHLVKQKKLVEDARVATKEAGAEKLFGTFDDETAARRFASGLS
jgi:MFS superfamily sulfate permease-like transporter